MTNNLPSSIMAFCRVTACAVPAPCFVVTIRHFGLPEGGFSSTSTFTSTLRFAIKKVTFSALSVQATSQPSRDPQISEILHSSVFVWAKYHVTAFSAFLSQFQYFMKSPGRAQESFSSTNVFSCTLLPLFLVS